MQTMAFKVDWASKSTLRGPGERSLGELLQKLRDRLAPEAMGLSITYVDHRTMRKLNSAHRGIAKTTDVLSFPSFPEKGAFPHLGDLVICLPEADRMAEKLGVSRRREVETLIIHGFLHLCGFDHETDQGEMLALQEELERELLGEEPLQMALKRGRKPGSKVKVLKDGSRVVVTGRAAKALERKTAQAAPKSIKAPPTAATAPKRSAGRPRKDAPSPEPTPQGRRPIKRRRTAPRARTGVIA